MNQHHYRLIFNRARGLMMAVAEHVTSRQGGTTSSVVSASTVLDESSIIAAATSHIANTPGTAMSLHPLRWSLLCMLGLGVVYLPTAHAAIVADPSAAAQQQPMLTSTASGIPQVNIQTPSAAGVSHNSYRQFDVSQQGVILNNSITNVQTQLGGYLQGNPYLGGGTARVILNEVNSSNPSLLNGYIEVAGSRAQVIIANPAGISCDGCGFINANRATLATGTPIMANGNLLGYRVGGGSVQFLGAGLDSRQANYTDVIARAVQVNAGIFANNLNVITGTNQVNVDTNGHQTSITPIAANAGNPAPSYAVDVAALGGMYAGKIHLIGTEAGLGVRNAGSFGASAGEVAITLDGQLTNGGRITSSSNAQIATTGTLDNHNAVIAAGGTLTIHSAALNNDQGRMQATDALSIDTQGHGLLNTNTQISGGIVSDGAMQLTTGHLDNTAGYIGAVGNLSAQSASITNTSGRLLAQGDMALTLQSNFHNTGDIIANGALQFTSNGTLTNSGKLQAADTLQVNVANLDNTAAGELTGLNTHITSSGTVTNRGLIDGGDTYITADTLTNLGTVFGDHIALAANTLTNTNETVGGIPHAGVIAARDRFDIGATKINNTGNALLFSANDMAIGGTLDTDHLATGQASQLMNVGSTIEALGALTASVADLQNRNAGITTQTVAAGSTAYDQFIPRDQSVVLNSADYPGAQIGNFNISWRTAGPYTFREYTRLQYTGTTTDTQLVTTQPGQLLSGGNMTLTGAVTNSDSHILAGNILTINGPALANLNTTGTSVSQYHGTNKYYDYDGDESCGDPSDGCYDISSAPYNPADSITTFNLPTTRVEQHTTPTSTGTTIGARTTANVSQTVSSNSLFQPAPNPSAGYLIETNPRFADYRTWLSSDYMLSQLSFDGDITLKRLGDGFYEQRLIREQVSQLTGRRFLTGYANDEAQYQALMNAGVTVANSLQLRPGIALSAAQAAQLTADIVWLVQQTVTLPDGSTALALVPQVYVAVKPNDLNPTTGMLTGNQVQINLSGDLTNGGTIAGRSLVSLAANNLNNLGGNIRGASTLLTARQDIHNIGGTISAEDALLLNAARDITLQSTTQSSSNAQRNGTTSGASSFSRTNIDRVAGLYTSNPNAILVANAGNDINLMAAAIHNSGTNGTTQLSAGNNLTLGTVQIAEQNNSIRNSKNYLKLGSTQDIGTVIHTQGDIQLAAGQDASLQAATVNSTEGNLNVVAGRDISILAGESTRSLDFARKSKKSGTLSSTTNVYQQTYDGTDAVSSELGAREIVLQAGSATTAGNVNIAGSNVITDVGTTITASNNVTIAAAETTSQESNYKSTKKSGFSSSGTSVSYGTSKLSTNRTTDSVSNTASTVGSTNGDVSITAGKAYTQTGSDVLAPQGDIAIQAQQVNIDAARNTSSTVTETKFKQTGITLAISNPVVNAIQTAKQMQQAASQTSDGRMQALAAGTTALAAKNAYDAVKTAQAIKSTGNTTQDAANQVGGVNISLSVGASKSSSKSTQTSDTAQGSNVTAGGDIRITATGAGQDSDVNVIGSQIKANNISIKADDQITLLAAKNTETLNSANKNSSASVGMSAGTSGLAVTASASMGKGKANGTDVTWTETILGASNKVMLESGTDTSLIGAQVKGNRVIADVGTTGQGNLNIQSLQDTSTYDSKQKNMGISVSVPIGAGAYGGSISGSSTKIQSDYASVNEQAGILAGDGGFQVSVAGNTALAGAVIASTEQAIQDGKNNLITETLTISNINNKADYDAKALSATIGGGLQAGLPQLSGAGYGKDSNKADSATVGAVSQGTVIITDGSKQQDLTGKDAAITVALLNRDVHVDESGNAVDSQGNSTAATIAPIFDQEKVTREIQAQVEITQSFSEQQHQLRIELNKKVDVAKAEKNAIAEMLKNQDLSEEQRIDLIARGMSAQKEIERLENAVIVLSTIGAGLSAPTNNIGGIFSNTLAPMASNQIGQYFKDHGTEGSAPHILAHGVLASAVAALGGNNPLGAAISAMSGELVAPLVADLLYGKSSEELNAEQKATVSTIARLGGVAASAGIDNGANNLAQANLAAQNAVDNNWGMVGHYSTMATLLYLGGLSSKDAKALALAAWGPDTDKRNAITLPNIYNGADSSQPQIATHLLNGQKDILKVVAEQKALAVQLRGILLEIKKYENDPNTKAMYLSRPDVQNILHEFGDAFAHVQPDGTRYDPEAGHGLDSLLGNDPDNPSTNAGNYKVYVSTLFAVASQINTPRVSNDIVTNMANDVTKYKYGQLVTLYGAIGNVTKKEATSMVRSPVPECGLLQNCQKLEVGSQVNPVIQQLYGVRSSKSKK